MVNLFWLWILCLVPFQICCEKVQVGTGLFSPSDDNEYVAIKTIHKQLDDNADGSVDFSESAEFVQTELCGGPVTAKEEAEREVVCTGSEKSLKFHQTDTEITSTELWFTWHQNKVFNWTNENVLEWLESYVELPQYSSAFRENQITGRQLPYVAINSGLILQNSLLITDGRHKKKIQLRAMDIILFGPPVKHGHWKDTILKISAFLIVCSTIYALRQRQVSKSRIDSFIEDLRLKEEEVKRLKSKFEAIERESTDGPALTTSGSEEEDIRERSPPLMMAPTPTSSGSEDESHSVSYCKSCSGQVSDSVLSQAQANIELLQQRVWSLEEDLEARMRTLQLLEELLPECQQKEREQLEFRKSVVEEKMGHAQRACEKIKKRRSSLFGTLHLANSTVLEEAGLQITKAVNRMQVISEHFEEHHKRWNKIGQICGFHVSSPSTLKSLSPRSSTSGETKPSIISRHDISHFRYAHRSSLHEERLFTRPSPPSYRAPNRSSSSVTISNHTLFGLTALKQQTIPVIPSSSPSPSSTDDGKTVTGLSSGLSSSGASSHFSSPQLTSMALVSRARSFSQPISDPRSPNSLQSSDSDSGRSSREGSVDVGRGLGHVKAPLLGEMRSTNSMHSDSSFDSVEGGSVFGRSRQSIAPAVRSRGINTTLSSDV